MAVVTDLEKVTVTAKLNNGTSAEGKVQTLNCSLAQLNIDRYDDQKAMNIINLMKPCLSKEVYETQKTPLYIMSNSD